MKKKAPQLIFSDFDGTLTRGEALTRDFFTILELLKENGAELIVTTGRSVPWGYFLLEHFPMRVAILEGGGVIVYKENGHLRQKVMVDDEEIEALARYRKEFLEILPGPRFSIDSYSRFTDCSIELDSLDLANLPRVEKFCSERGLVTYQSNVHFHFSLPGHDKWTAMEYVRSEYFPDTSWNDAVFFGDSLNDVPVFAAEVLSVGVSNCKLYLNQMTSRPDIILEGPENEGALGVLSYLKEAFKN